MAKAKTAGRGGKKSTPNLRVLFTCVGRRVELLEAFRAAALRLRCGIEIHGADATRLSPAIHHVDKKHIVPSIASGRYIDALLRIVRTRKIDVLIPLIDSELAILSESADRFAELGCRALISAESVIRICGDKLGTHEMLVGAGIDTPKTWRWSDVLKRKRHRFPYFMKPNAGSAAVGNYIIRNVDELTTLGRLVRDPIVQEFVDGVEHTLDVYTGFDGKPRCVVPRRRIEVRSGEVSKAVVVKDPAIMAVGRRVVETLADCQGVVTVQCMVTADGRIRVIEINARFGGGAPLAIRAGADFPKWILAELLGSKPKINSTGFRDKMVMLRYDQSVFIPNGAKLFGD